MTLARLRLLFLVVTPLTLAVVLWWHPAGGSNVFEGVRDDADAWLFVHAGMLFLLPLLGIGVFVLVRGLDSRAALVGRIAVVFFLVFFTAYEVSVGVGTGILVDYANGLPAAEQAAVAHAIQDYNRTWIVTDPSIAMIGGALAWIVAMVAAAVAFQRSGAGWPVTLLVGGAALFAIHPPPMGPVGLVCFASAAVLLERSRAHDEGRVVDGLDVELLD